MLKPNQKIIISLLIILCIAGFFRLYSLHTIPPGFWPDEAMNANDVLTNPGKVFYPENNGREGLFINLIGVSFKIFGPSPFSQRLVSAIIGILTVLGLFLLTKELFKVPGFGLRIPSFKFQAASILALLASFFLAISFWHVNFSRIGFRAIMLPFILVFSFYFFFKGFKNKNIINLVLAGIFFGLGFYTYSSFRLAPFILLSVLLLFWYVARKQKEQKKFFILSFYFLLTIVIIALPLGLYFLAHPADFFGRLGEVSVFSQNNPIKALAVSLGKHLAMFNFAGDTNWRHNLSGSPQLLWPVGILFLVGFLISLKNLFVSKKQKNYQLFVVYCFLFLWFLFMLLAGALTAEGAPHSLRTIGVIPVVFIFVALGAFYIFEKIKGLKFFSFGQQKQYLKYFLWLAMFFLAFSLFTAEFQKYFVIWAKNPNVPGAFTQRFVDMGNYLNSLPQNVQKYVIVNENGTAVPYPDGIPVLAQTTIFVERMKYGEPRAIYLKPEQINEISKTDQPKVIIPFQFNQEISAKIKEAFPNAHLWEINGIKVYKIN